MSDPLEKRLGRKKDAREFLGLLIDHVLEEPIKAFVDPETVLKHLDRALDVRITEAFVTEHLRPFIDREKARAQTRGDLVKDWLSSEMQAELRSASMRPVHLDREFLRTAVQDASVKHMVKSIVKETLDRFVTTLKPGGAGGGLVGSVGRSALGFASRAGKGLLGQLGGQFEQHLQSAVSSFVTNSTSIMLDRLVVILTHPETAQHLGRSGVTVYDAILKQTTDRVWRFIDKEVPLDDLLDALPDQCLHLLGRDEVRQGILEEVGILLDALGDQTIGSLFAEDAHLQEWRAEVIELGIPICTRFAKSKALKDWLKA